MISDIETDRQDEENHHISTDVGIHMSQKYAESSCHDCGLEMSYMSSCHVASHVVFYVVSYVAS